MRVPISLAFLAFAAVAFIACNSVDRSTSTSPFVAKAPPGAPKAANDGVRRITTAELKDLMAKGQAFVVDVRNEASYKQGHIAGAVLIPTIDVPSRAKELPRDKTIVTYCS